MSAETLHYEALVAGLIAIAMGVVMAISGGRNRPNYTLSAATVVVGVALITTTPFLGRVDPVHPSLSARLQGIGEVIAILLYSWYMLEALALSSLSGARTRIVRGCAIATMLLGAWHAFASATWPAARLNTYELGLGAPGVLSKGDFWLFAAFWLVLAVPYILGWSLLAFGEIDLGEARRSRAAVIASTLIIAVTVTPPEVFPYLVAVWLGFAVYAQLQYVAAQAQRGVFLSRFLSPQVAQLVASRGLSEAVRPHHSEISVVCADLRGFTAYSEDVPSQAVVDLLAAYYDAVGLVVARHGGTITNYAGDGILILVGAPLPVPDHAARAIRIAREIQVAVEPVRAEWQTRRHPLGLGVGVATGAVTVGAISAETRMEYTAIGIPVNLAARLCSAASAGEILIDAEAALLSGCTDLTSRGTFEVKGFSEPQPVFALAL